ncbi:MAG TPA: hypothetical protein VMB48_16060 [Steroidobacteraceae bacterium]|nr:hypothetical protein [Steroidobacteraceae bacterium]
MSVKRKGFVRNAPEPDDASGITDEWIEGADLYLGKKVICRGRPKLANPRKLLSLRLPPDVITGWKATGAEALSQGGPRHLRCHGAPAHLGCLASKMHPSAGPSSRKPGCQESMLQ